MLGRLRTATKFFTVGLALGLFFAPRSGEQTRKQVMNSALAPIRRRRKSS